MTRDDVFRIIDLASNQVLQCQEQSVNGIKRIEHVVPFVDGDYSLSVWAFYATDEDMQKGSSVEESFRSDYVSALRNHGYDPAWLGKVGFVFDSIENVDTNFEGSLFYRMR